MTMTKTMFLEIGRRRFQIASFEEASRMFCAARDKMGEGSSRTPRRRLLTSEATLSATFPTTGAYGRAIPMWPVPPRCTTTAKFRREK